jgi:hypothetical protein
MDHLFGGLTDYNDGPAPLILQLRQQLCGSQHARDVNVMAAGMHDTHFLTSLVFGFCCARVWQAGPLFDRQGVEFCPQQNGWPGAVFQNRNYSVTGPSGVLILADLFRDRVAERA